MQAWTAQPVAAGKYPGLFVFQEAFGVNAHIREVTERFAREGYVAISPELYHRTAPPGFAVSYDDYPALAPHIGALNRAAAEADRRRLRGVTRPRVAKEPMVRVGNIHIHKRLPRFAQRIRHRHANRSPDNAGIFEESLRVGLEG